MVKRFEEFLANIDDAEKREKLREILSKIKENFPELNEEIRWNQPMFTDHETFIIALSVAKAHIAVAPETEAIARFSSEIEKAGYSHTKGIFRIKWSDKVDYDLIYRIVAYNIESKKGTKSFWR